MTVVNPGGFGVYVILAKGIWNPRAMLGLLLKELEGLQAQEEMRRLDLPERRVRIEELEVERILLVNLIVTQKEKWPIQENQND